MDLATTTKNDLLVHVMGKLQVLIEHYEGWCNDYVGQEDSATAQVLATALLTLFKPSPACDAATLLGHWCNLLVQLDVWSWSAVDQSSGKRWNPWLQSYAQFCAKHRKTTPFLGRAGDAHQLYIPLYVYLSAP